MLIVNDIICDNFFQQALLFPEHFDVVATMNLNGDYLSDALAAQVGGLGIAPGSNINFQTGAAIFEATHGTAPQLARKKLRQSNLADFIRCNDVGVSGMGESSRNDQKSSRAGYCHAESHAGSSAGSCSAFHQSVW